MINKEMNPNLKIKFFLLWALGFGLSGCASVTYDEPISGPIAHVRFAMHGPSSAEGFWGASHNVSIYKYDTQACDNEDTWLNLSAVGLINNPKRDLGIPLNSFSNSTAKELRVTANFNTTFLFKSNGTQPNAPYRYNLNTSCGVPVAARFAENSSYEVLFLEPNFGKCEVILSEIVRQNGNYVRKRIKNFSNLVGEEFVDCKKAFYRARW